MRWSAQVLHVVRKDLRRFGALVLMFVAGVVFVTAQSLAMRAGGSFLGALLVVPAAILIVGLVVQEDSPSRVDAFWATRPLDPLAVMTAKFVVIAPLFVAALIGQWLLLRAHVLSQEVMVDLLGASAAWLGFLLLVAFVLASLTTDLRTFVLSLIGATIAWMAVYSTVMAWRVERWVTTTGTPPVSGMVDEVTLWAIVAFCIGWIALGAHQYRTRNVRRGVILAAVLLLASAVILGPPRPTQAGKVTMGYESRGSQTQGLTITELRLDRKRDGGSDVVARFDLSGVTPGDRITLDDVRLEVRESDGDTIVVAEGQGAGWRPWTVTKSRSITVQDPGPVLGGADRWLDDEAQAPRPSYDSSRFVLLGALSAAETRALVAGERLLRISGVYTIDRVTPVATIPLEAGHRMAEDGVRFEVTGVEQADGHIVVDARSSVVEGAGDAAYADGRSMRERSDEVAGQYAMVNPVSGEGVRLRPRSSSWTMSGLIAPGPTVVVRTARLRTPEKVPVEIDDTWLREAHLVLFERRPVRTASLRLEVPGSTLDRR